MDYDKREIALAENATEMGFVFCSCVSFCGRFIFFGEQANPNFREVNARVFAVSVDSSALLSRPLPQRRSKP